MYTLTYTWPCVQIHHFLERVGQTQQTVWESYRSCADTLPLDYDRCAIEKDRTKKSGRSSVVLRPLSVLQFLGSGSSVCSTERVRSTTGVYLGASLQPTLSPSDFEIQIFDFCVAHLASLGILILFVRGVYSPLTCLHLASQPWNLSGII